MDKAEALETLADELERLVGRIRNIGLCAVVVVGDEDGFEIITSESVEDSIKLLETHLKRARVAAFTSPNIN